MFPTSFPSHSDTLAHIYDTASVLIKLVFATDIQQSHSRFQINKTFFFSSSAKFYIQSSGRTEGIKQVRRKYLIINSDQNFLNFFFMS
jgi:hypothetical protein